MEGGVVMYKLFKFIGIGTAEALKLFDVLPTMFSSKTKKNNIAISSKYKVPKNDRESIQGDYKRIGKDLYKALRNYEQRGTKQPG